jgi:uncharacterized protein with HEPN domain
VPWKRLGGFRDVLAHAYHRVDLDLVWEVVESELPGLRERMDRLVSSSD